MLNDGYYLKRIRIRMQIQGCMGKKKEKFTLGFLSLAAIWRGGGLLSCRGAGGGGFDFENEKLSKFWFRFHFDMDHWILLSLFGGSSWGTFSGPLSLAPLARCFSFTGSLSPISSFNNLDFVFFSSCRRSIIYKQIQELFCQDLFS